jgi:hypothetical protein
VVIRLDDAGPTRTRVRIDHLGFAAHAAAAPEHQDEWKTVREHFEQAWPIVLEAMRRTAALDHPVTPDPSDIGSTAPKSKTTD